MLGSYLKIFLNYIVVFSVFVITFVYTRPQYVKLIPNADSVPDPCHKPVPGENQKVWRKVGHMVHGRNPYGLNPFGQDFASSGLTFTRDLCLADSDGDGMPNYEELGLNKVVCTYLSLFLGTNEIEFNKRYGPKYKYRDYIYKKAKSHPGICESGSPSCKRPDLRAETLCPPAQTAPPAQTVPFSGSFFNQFNQQG